MVPEVILHIGMHKTGTTSIQSALNNFDDGRVRYAQLNDVNHSIPICSLFSKYTYEYHVHKSFGRSREEIDTINDNTVIDLERELNMDREKIIISGEDISALKADEVQSLVAWLSARAGSLKVLAYVRDPLGFASSVLQQCIYGGMRKTCIPTPDYKNRFEAYTLCSEVDSIEFVEFKKNELVNGSVVFDFCSRIGFDGSGLQERRINESMSLECTQLLYHLNRFGILTSGSTELVNARRQFSHFLSENFKGDSFRIPKDWVLAHVDMNDISWMEKVSGIQLVPTGLVNPDLVESDSLDELEEIMGHIDEPTLRKLQKFVSDIDVSVGSDTNMTNLLNFLFTSFYFKESYTQENAKALAVGRGRQEKLVADHEKQHAKQQVTLAERKQEIEMARMATEELRERESVAKAELIAMEQRGFIARLLNKKPQSMATGWD
jgi:hypothetical protein